MEAVIFCGIQATGKTSFYKEKFFETHMRISMDQLHTRNKERLFLETCFSIQQPFVVDNTNPSKAEREKYIHLAKQYKYKVTGYYFQSVLAAAVQRNSGRSGKANIPEAGIRGTYKRLELPSVEEGFDELYFVGIQEGKFIIKAWNNEV
ncbi:MULTISPECIES: AAA family ATPase [Chitinophaga]|uniref:AAA family ATPase n=1 Tax=Chitinophaga TaxID=79328 RepID=UPI000DBA7372|nr:AAA family ATPase [Chitinophaga ginsengisegetis]MDR6570505.1 putative kinase [Chitinophaga ginsengisegetis]MDR6650239.1 putative kinase [Chitinophaga ginsengisegetis]MDR6656642.1 putative kinase [Chitinophaga ginsengisegetis]